MCELYQTSKSNVSEHIKHIFEEGELLEESVVRKFRTTATDGKSYLTTFYNLDKIIALGYRVRSITATRFRQWATLRLKEYITKGFTLDDDRLKKLGGGGYWKELLERIRDKKVMAENVGSSDIWSDGVEKSENCRTQTLPLTLLCEGFPPHAKRQLPLRKRLLQRRLLLARQRRPLLLKRNSLFYCLILQKTPTYLIGWSLFLLNSLAEQRAQIRRGFQNKPHFFRNVPHFLRASPRFTQIYCQIYSNLLPDLLKSAYKFTQFSLFLQTKVRKSQ